MAACLVNIIMLTGVMRNQHIAGCSSALDTGMVVLVSGTCCWQPEQTVRNKLKRAQVITTSSGTFLKAEEGWGPPYCRAVVHMKPCITRSGASTPWVSAYQVALAPTVLLVCPQFIWPPKSLPGCVTPPNACTLPCGWLQFLTKLCS
jgi:hypothetical protein